MLPTREIIFYLRMKKNGQSEQDATQLITRNVLEYVTTFTTFRPKVKVTSIRSTAINNIPMYSLQGTLEISPEEYKQYNLLRLRLDTVLRTVLGEKYDACTMV